MRPIGLIALATAMILALSAPRAQAGLIGSGNSVQALFHFFDTITNAEDTTPEPEVNPATPTPLNAPATIPAGATDLTQLDFADTKITITNQGNLPFCSTALPCASSEFWAFEFKFSGSIDITGASVDGGTASDFMPTNTKLQLLSPTDVEVEVTGD